MSNEGIGRGTRPVHVHLLCGLVGAGKTTCARQLAAELPAVRFSLDEWMLRLYQLRYDEPEYPSRRDTCTSVIWETAQQILNLGRDVVLDWNQWSVERRRFWRQRAEAAGHRVVLHHIDVSLDTAIRQSQERTADDAGTSHRLDEADVRHFATIFQAPTPDEGIETVTHSTFARA